MAELEAEIEAYQAAHGGHVPDPDELDRATHDHTTT